MTISLSHAGQPPQRCLAGFERINRFWDRQRNVFVAKILPGEFYVTRNNEIIATTLGSCVAACIWDPQARIGGMNHFMLPLTLKDCKDVKWGNVASDATRYGNYAMEHMINELLKNGASKEHLQAKVFGGARVMQWLSDVGASNADFVLDYLRTENIPLVSGNLRDIYPRKILFNPLQGRVMMKQLRSSHNDTIGQREHNYQMELAKARLDGDIELF